MVSIDMLQVSTLSYSPSLVWNDFVVPSWKIVCYKCGLKMFQELAYQFRVQMPLTDINPVILRNRVNCYYGKRCRTQFTKIPHAEKFNHACDQVKF